MNTLVFSSVGNSFALAKKTARKLKAKYSSLTVRFFPDGDLYLKFNFNLKNKTLVLFNSFQPQPNLTLLKILFAAKTARDLGAKKIILVAPYLAYLRQDKRFHPGECLSSKVLADLLNSSLDQLFTLDPHIHRYSSLADLFNFPAHYLTTNSLIASYLKKHFKDHFLVGPDEESYQWAKRIAEKIKVPVTILKKTRLTSRRVKIKIVSPLNLQNQKVVIVDDIVSTGHTVIEAAKQLWKLGVKSISVICVHGLFVEDALKKIKKAGIKQIISTNTVEHVTNQIDVSPLIVEGLLKEIKKTSS